MIARNTLASLKGAFRGFALSDVPSRRIVGCADARTVASDAMTSSNHAAQEAAMQLLFFVVALLLIADLHSSFMAGPTRWESNPVVAAVAEHVGLPVALAITKLFDAVSLRVLYAVWCRTQAHVATGTLLGIVALHYLPIVLENYFR